MTIKYGGSVMVMTSYMYHLMFEPIRENECIYLLNEIKCPKIGQKKLDINKAKLNNEKEKLLCVK